MEDRSTIQGLGKIEDAGRLVNGGAIDRHWREEGIRIDTQKYTGNSNEVKGMWLRDSNIALEHFNLRSIEFGNWMSQQDRANFLYASMLGLHYLAKILGVKDKAMGLGGKLSIALGARGSGNANASYENLPYSIINITKPHATKGNLAHEFAHALDNIISFHTKKKQKYVTGGRTIRMGFDEEVAAKGNYFEKQFEEFFNLLYFDAKGNDSAFQKRLERYDEYWVRRNEVFSRAFEVYVAKKLKQKKLTNIFLAQEKKTAPFPTFAELKKVEPLIKKITSKGFELMNKNVEGLKGIQSDIPSIGYRGFRTVLRENASLDEVLESIKEISLRDAYQVTQLSKELQGATVKATANNLWNFIRENFTYREDKKGEEQLRTPSRTIADRIFDCDDATIFVSAILINLGIDHEYRITAYERKGEFGHIYPVAFDENGKAYVIDAVPEIPHFNYEEKPIIDLKTVSMKLVELSGVSESLSNEEVKQDILKDLHEPFTLAGIDEDEEDENEEWLSTNFLQGLGEVEREEEADVVISNKQDAVQLLENGILSEVNKAKLSLEREEQNPSPLSEIINVRTELKIIQNLMQSWTNPSLRESILVAAIQNNSSYKNFYIAIKRSLEELYQESASLNGFEDDEPIYLARMEDMELSDLLEDEREGLGRRKRKRRGFFRKTFKKFSKGLKKVVKSVVRYNPATILLRNSILLVLKLNLFNLSARIIYGYLSQEEAEARNLNLDEWRKLVEVRKKAELFFMRSGGKRENFKKAIVKGKAAKKTGVQLSGLGEVTAASTAAASGFMIYVKKLLSNINPKNLYNKVKSKFQEKRAERQARKDVQALPPQSGVDFTEDDFKTEDNDSLSTSSTKRDPNNEDQPQGIMEKLKSIWVVHKVKVIGAGVIVVAAFVFIPLWKKKQKKKKNQLRGLKAARTRARNRQRNSRNKPLAASKSPTTRRRRKTSPTKRKPKVLGRGNTTVVRTPTKGRGKTRVSQQSSKERLSLMHAKAQQLRKKHPKTKYSKLLSMASKQM